jgi:hypothetical protein
MQWWEMKRFDIFRIYFFHGLLAICLTLAVTYGYYLLFGVPPGSIGQTIIIFIAIVVGVIRPIGIVNDRKRAAR